MSRRKHAGLKMFEQLGWINKFIEDGSYQVNNGARYIAELGILMRGATISTGMMAKKFLK